MIRKLFTTAPPPPVMRRLVRNYILASFVFAALALAFGLLRKPLGVSRVLGGWGRYGPLVLGAMPLCVFTPLAWWKARRVRRQFAEANGRLCTHCAYIVGPMGDTGICPECGEQFNAEPDAAMWASIGFKRNA